MKAKSEKYGLKLWRQDCYNLCKCKYAARNELPLFLYMTRGFAFICQFRVVVSSFRNLASDHSITIDHLVVMRFIMIE